jgi:hypothetical protein
MPQCAALEQDVPAAPPSVETFLSPVRPRATPLDPRRSLPSTSAAEAVQVLLRAPRVRSVRQRAEHRNASTDKENTTIVNGAGKKKDIEGRTNQIKAQIEETTSDYDREKLQERPPSSLAG